MTLPFAYGFSGTAGDLATPINVFVSVQGEPSSKTLRVSWQDQSEGEAQWEIQRRQNGGSWSLVHTMASSDASGTGGTETWDDADAGKLYDTLYEYQVRAIAPGIESAWSSSAGEYTDDAPFSGTPTWETGYPQDDPNTDDQISLLVDIFPDAQAYEVYGRQGASMVGFDPTDFTLVYTGSDLDSSGFFHVVNTGEEWFYQFRATKVGQNGRTVESDWSAEGDATAESNVTEPGVPTNLSTTVTGATEITFDWDHPDTGDDPDLYRLQRAVNGGTFDPLTTVNYPNSQYVDGAVLEGNSYEYQVRAENAGGESSYVTGISVCVGQEPGVLSWTSTFPKKNAGDPTGAFDWSFESPTGTWDTIRVRYRPEGTSDPWVEFTSGSLSGTRSGLADGEDWEVQGRAENACNQVSSSYSALGFFSTDLAAPTETPVVTAAPSADDEITASWGPIQGADSYDLEWIQSSTVPSGSGTLVVLGNVTSYDHPSLSANTKYYYRVRAVNAGGDGPWSDWEETASATTLLSAPANFSAVHDTQACPTIEVDLSWSLDNDAGDTRDSDTMTIERSENAGSSWINVDSSVTAGLEAYNASATEDTDRFRIKFNDGDNDWAEVAVFIACPD